MSDDYEVGYGKPPKHGQFKMGKSGNPKGRPKSSQNFRTDLEETLHQAVTINEKGRPRIVSSQKAALLRLLEKALKGDPRALDRFLALAAEHSAETEARQAERGLSQSDADILARYEETVRNEGSARKAGEGESDG